MVYYPKSQIKTNLYTNGNEYVTLDTDDEYIGYYYELSNGNTFTGRTPDDGPNIRIVLDDHPVLDYINPDLEESNVIYPPETPPTVIQNLGHGYYPGAPPFRSRSLPSSVLTIPSQKDYDLGEFQRYFAKKHNQNIYLEINKETCDQLKNRDPNIAFDLYTAISLSWDLSGDQTQTYTTNKNTVILIENKEKWYGFEMWFKDDFLKYYKSSTIQEDLFTDGTEFINRRTKLTYRGPYHIHPEKGPMVGAKHIQREHDYLDPIQSTQDPLIDIQPTQTPPPAPTNLGRDGSYYGSPGGY